MLSCCANREKGALSEEPEKSKDELADHHSLSGLLELPSAQHLYKEAEMQGKPRSNAP